MPRHLRAGCAIPQNSLFNVNQGVAPSGRPGGAQRDMLGSEPASRVVGATCFASRSTQDALAGRRRSEEHTSELQSQSNLVCRLLLEKKKKYTGPTNLGGANITRTSRRSHG